MILIDKLINKMVLDKSFCEEVSSISTLFSLGSTNYDSDKNLMSTQRFNEAFLRLQMRVKAWKSAQLQMATVGPEVNLEYAQLELVDRLEAVHQQVYVVMSNFAKLLSHLLEHKYSSQIPIKRLEKFLDLKWLPSSVLNNQVKEDSLILKKSREFRTILVAHPQHYPIVDWSTTTFDVIYNFPFQDKSESKVKDLDWTTNPMTRKDCIIPPKVEDCIFALKSFVIEILQGFLKVKTWSFSQEYLGNRLGRIERSIYTGEATKAV